MRLLESTLSFDAGAIPPADLARLFAEGVEVARATKQERDEQEETETARRNDLVREVLAMANPTGNTEKPLT